MPEQYLCVGGPAEGQWYAPVNGTTQLLIPRLRGFDLESALRWPQIGQIPADVPIADAYVLEHGRLGERRTAFWRWAELPSDAAIHRFIALLYEQEEDRLIAAVAARFMARYARPSHADCPVCDVGVMTWSRTEGAWLPCAVCGNEKAPVC